MKRIRPVDMLVANEESDAAQLASLASGAAEFGAGGGGDVFGVMDDQTWEAGDDPLYNDDGITHQRARQLILEQTHRLLPAAEANALADHLLICDPCYRFAQDTAAKERRRASGELK